MRQLRIQNPILDPTYKTFLSSDYSSGVTASVLNNNSFAANDLGVFGEPSEELTELKKIDSISGNTVLNLPSALKFAHGKGTIVYKSLWDFVSIEGRSSSAGVFAEITQSGIQWDSKSNETIYYHSAGDDNWEYRFRFYNSVTLLYSEYSPTLTGAGFTRKMVGYMIREVRKLADDLAKKIVTDDEIIRFFNEAQDIIYTHNQKYWFLLVDTYKQQTGISVTADTTVYSLSIYSTFGHLDTLRYHYNSGGTSRLYHLRKKGSVDFDSLTSDLSRGGDDWAEVYKLLPADTSSVNGYIQIDPIPQSTGVGTLYPNYYEKMADLDSVDDTTQVPLPRILEQYAIGKIEMIKGNSTKGQLYLSGLISDDEDKIPRDLLQLDKLDNQQKDAVGQPRNLIRFRGQRGHRNTYGNPRFNADIIREHYDYD